MPELKDYLKEWSEKLSLSVEKIEKEYNRILEDEKVVHAKLTLDEQKQRALKRLALSYKKMLRSPAEGFEGFIIGTTDCVDMIVKQKREASQLYKEDPQLAISQGVTNEDGVPLNTRKEWNNGKANPSFGKPLPEHNFIRNVFGIAYKANDDKKSPRFFSITLQGEKAENENIPTFKPIRFMAIDKTPKEITNKFALNSSSFTSFDVTKNVELKIMEMIDICCEDNIVELNQLEEYHQKERENYNRLVIVSGEVSSLNLEPTSFGSRVLILEDLDNIGDLDAKSVTCWIPSRQEIDFAEGSKVLVVGRTAQGKKKDEHGNPTEELGNVSINVFGLYAIPEFKVALPEEVKPITEENLETN